MLPLLPTHLVLSFDKPLSSLPCIVTRGLMRVRSSDNIRLSILRVKNSPLLSSSYWCWADLQSCLRHWWRLSLLSASSWWPTTPSYSPLCGDGLRWLVNFCVGAHGLEFLFHLLKITTTSSLFSYMIQSPIVFNYPYITERFVSTPSLGYVWFLNRIA